MSNNGIDDIGVDTVVIETTRQSYQIFLPNRNTDYIQSTIARELRPYEAPMLKAIAENLAPETLVLDVGANVGNHTLFLCAATGCRVVAYEPNRALSDAIIRSVKLNRFEDLISVREVGVGATAGHGFLTHFDPSNLGTQRIELSSNTQDLQIIALDDESFDKPVGIIKIDVEGMELAVLSGATQLLSRDRPEVYVECVDLAAFMDVDAFMVDNGYVRTATYNFTPTHRYVSVETPKLSALIRDALQSAAVHDYESRVVAADREANLKDQRASIRKHDMQANEMRARLREHESQIRDLKALLHDRGVLLRAQQLRGQETSARLLDAQAAYKRSRIAVRDLRLQLQTTNITLERRARNAESAYERVHSEALRYRDADNAQTARLLSARRDIGKLTLQARALEKSLLNSQLELRRTKRRVSLRIANFLGRVRKNPSELGRVPRVGARLVRSLMLRGKHGSGARSVKSVKSSAQNRPFKRLEPSFLSRSPRYDSQRLTVASERAHLAGVRLAERQKPGIPLRVAAIVDEFTANGFGPDCDLLNVDRTEWKSKLQEFDADILFVESAWRGSKGSWHNLVSRMPVELVEILEWCRERGIATVFWNKEDPVHFETFLKTASHFDHVYTTDIDMVPVYKRELGHERVGLLPFASQPRVHNPIETTDRKSAMVFAGGYYKKYPERMRDLDAILQGAAGVMPVEIFDRNYGTTLQDYAFPASFDEMIVGTLQPEEINVAYKGYAVALNLNSVKSSNSMFARRVFELLMSGTPTISNYTQGLSNVFGDLVPASDSSEEVSAILLRLADDKYRDKLRSQALHKVLREHTYARRLEMVAAHISGGNFLPSDPIVAVVASVTSLSEMNRLMSVVSLQSGVNVELLIISDDSEATTAAKNQGARLFSSVEADSTCVSDLSLDCPIAVLDIRDWYGSEYLESLVQGFLYSDAQVNTKREHFLLENRALSRVDAGVAHRVVNQSDVEMRRSMANIDGLGGASMIELVEGPVAFRKAQPVLAVDPYDYCEGGAAQVEVAEHASSTAVSDTGVSLEDLYRSIPANEGPATSNDLLVLDPSDLNANRLAGQELQIIRQGFGSLKLSYGRGQGVAPMWSANMLDVEEHFAEGVARFRLETMGSLVVQFIAQWRDSDGKILRTDIEPANTNLVISVPLSSSAVKVGYRLRAPGTGVVRYMGIGNRSPVPMVYVSKRHSRTLLISPGYPSYEDLYRLGFVHSRVAAYTKRKQQMDVFVHNVNTTASSYEFEGQKVTCGNTERLGQTLVSGDWDRLVVHFLNRDVWEAIRSYVPRLATTVWVHGVEIQPWWRRRYSTHSESEKAAAATPARLEFWREVLDDELMGISVVFVSETFRKQSSEDLKISLDSSNSAVIHNPIDTDLFQYREKCDAHRLRILSIRPYSSSLYANDLSVAAVLRLSEEDWFDELNFLFIGDGLLFDETLMPLRNFDNVTIQRGFLSRTEIAAVHADYGVFLVPSRADTQGVSRDEAMASGLVPVTTAAGSIPEFVGPDEGFVVDEEDVTGLASAISQLREDPSMFHKMSRAAAARVRSQAGSDRVIPQELGLIMRDYDV